ncbi:L96, partial [Symbiodinium necroappetens]
TLEAELGVEEPDWSGDESPDIPVAIAKTEEDEEMPAAEEAADQEAPKRPKRIVLATGQLALLRALAAANASNWADIQRTLKETPGEAGDKEDLVNNLTDLAATYAKNRAECSRAAALKAEELADLEGEEAEYLAALPPHLLELERKNPVRPSLSAHLGWVEHERFKRDAEIAGVWMARRCEKSRLRAAKHRASRQAETAGNAAQDPVSDRVDAGSHLSFQLREAARESLREFRAELRAGALDTPFRAGDVPKRKPESSRRRRLKWQRFSKKGVPPGVSSSSCGSTPPWLASSPAKYDPTDADRNHLFAQATCRPEEAPNGLEWERGFHWGILCAVCAGGLLWAATWCCRRAWGETVAHTTPKPPPAMPPWVAPGPRFSMSRDSDSEAEKRKAPMSEGSSPRAAKRAYPDNGPQAGVLPANAWARESLKLVRDHLSPATQRLYDSHWRWWELFTRRKGVSALRTVDRFDPGEEALFLDYLVYLFVGQGLAAATAQARLGAIRSVHLQLGFPDPLKPLPRLLLALEGIRRRRGPVTKRRPVTPCMLARANSALPLDLWGRLSCALQLGFFFLLRVSEIVGGSNPRLGLRVKDVALFCGGKQLRHPSFEQADEVQIVVRASKTDPEGETATRNLYRSGAEVCPVLATARYMVLLWKEFGEPAPTSKFFPHLSRQDIQEVLQT